MSTMTNQEKEAIRLELKTYCGRYPSQNKAAASLKGVSSGTISTILNEKFESISDEMFRNIRAQITSGKVTSGWQIVETPLFKDITFALSDAQESNGVTWIVSPAGSGKTLTARHYSRENKEVFYMLCDEDMRKADFIRELAQVIGIKIKGYKRIREILLMIIDELNEMTSPLLIFDEGDKLKDDVLYYFITLYNRLKESTGIVFLSTSYIQKRMRSGLSHDKKGYQEIDSRIGRKFYEAEPNTPMEVESISRANGISDRTVINRIIKDAEASQFDLRRVYKKVNAEKKKLAIA